MADGERNRFSECLDVLRQLADALGAPVTIVGGLAAIHHGAEVTTLDVDIAVSKDQLERILGEAQRCGLRLKRESPNGWHRFVFEHAEGDVEVHVNPGRREESQGPRPRAAEPGAPEARRLPGPGVRLVRAVGRHEAGGRA